MEESEILREMEEILKQLSPNRQRYLLELARASKQAEAYLEEPEPTFDPCAPAGESR